eukprot:2106634-Alexandrium_andersonii.AAC.1
MAGLRVFPRRVTPVVAPQGGALLLFDSPADAEQCLPAGGPPAALWALPGRGLPLPPRPVRRRR